MAETTPETDLPPLTPREQRNRKITLAVMAAAAVLVGLYSVRGRLTGRIRPTSGGVELRLRGTVSRANVHFTAPGGLVTQTLRLPWGYQLPLNNGQRVAVSATGEGTGDLTCEIVVSGRSWRLQQASGAAPTVSCEGVVGSH